MKTNKIGIVFLVSVMALAGVGSSYAMWYEDLFMDVTVTTGTFDIEWSLEAWDDDEIAEKDDVSTIDAYIEDDEASADYGKLIVTLTGVYPCINYWVDFNIHSLGSVPAHFENGWEFDTTGQALFDSGVITIENIDPPTGAVGIPGDDITTVQLHQGDSWYGRLNFHLTNELWDDPCVDPLGWEQGGGPYTFTISIMGHQYNEDPNNQ